MSMKQIMKKLRSRRGESLVEVLCAILIFTMSSVAMYSMVMAANNINASAKKADSAYQEQMLIVEKGETAGVQGTVTMTVSRANPSGGNDILAQVDIPVDVYQTEKLYSYFRRP